MSNKWFQSDPERAPDSDYDPGELDHLCAGNEGRLLDFRRTPVRIKEILYETGLATVEIMAFEDKGALWELPFEGIGSYQFTKDCSRASAVELEKIGAAVKRLDRTETVTGDTTKQEETLQTLNREREQAESWLASHSRFLQSESRLPEGEPEGDPLLYEDLKAYMDERGLLDLESLFSRKWASLYMYSEFIKAHLVAIARLGFASYRGKVIRDPSQTAGEFGIERRGEHVLARMGWVQALLRRCGRKSVVLYRMESCEGPLKPRQREGALVSASFRMDIVQEMSGWADPKRTVALYRQSVPVERVVMTYLETEALNHPFREGEAVLIAAPSNQAF